MRVSQFTILHQLTRGKPFTTYEKVQVRPYIFRIYHEAGDIISPKNELYGLTMRVSICSWRNMVQDVCVVTYDTWRDPATKLRKFE